MPTPAEDFLGNSPHYDRAHIEGVAARREADGTPYCWECHDWHRPDEEHSTIG